MFGYIGPEKDELKVREMAAYKAYYCGLCRALGTRFGQGARLILSYDCAFVALLVSALGDCGGCESRRCAYKPLKGKQPMAKPSAALDFAADLNVLLTYFKLRDNWQDEKKILGATGAWALRGAKDKAAASSPGLYAAIEHGIQALGELERDGCTQLDAPADAFAGMMRACLASVPAPEKQRRVLAELGYHIGRWIYLMDAWDDREKDARSGAYNPFLASGAGKERAGFLMYYSLNEAIRAYDLLGLQAHKGILDNILCLGCVERTKKLLEAGGEHEQ